MPSKNLVSMNSQPNLGGESLNLPNTNSILGVDDGKNFNLPLFGEDGLLVETKEWGCLQMELLILFRVSSCGIIE